MSGWVHWCEACERYSGGEGKHKIACLHADCLGPPSMGAGKALAPEEGKKYDSGKPPLTWIPRAALEQEAQVFRFGGEKYGRNNYKKGMDWTRLLDAAMRHITAFADGEDNDPDSGICHLAHARAGLAMVMYYMQKGKGTDDRSTG